MRKIKFDFERGGELIAELNDEKAPETVKRVLEALPFTSPAVHTRWCGREFSIGFATEERPPKENNSGIVSKFDVTYWRDWNSDLPLDEAPAAEAIAVYYGPEKLSYHGGLITANIIGRILWKQEKTLDEIGNRIWRQGIENVTVSLVEE